MVKKRIKKQMLNAYARLYSIYLRIKGYQVVLGKNVQIGRSVRFLFADSIGKLEIGDNCLLENDVTLRISHNANMTIQNNSTLKENCYCEVCSNAKLEIGAEVFINRNAIIVSAGEICIGDHVAFGPNVTIYDHDHVVVREGRQEWQKSKVGQVTIGDDCWIAANALILRNTTIGRNAVVGGGTIVKGTVPNSVICCNKNELVFKEIVDI